MEKSLNSIKIVASNIFPIGITINNPIFNPFDNISKIQKTHHATGANGDQIYWTKKIPIEIELEVPADSEEDVNLSTLFQANRATLNKRIFNDTISMEGKDSEGNFVRLKEGIIIGKSDKGCYNFRFEKAEYNTLS